MELTLHQLRLFLAVVDHETISAAAESLGYTPSAGAQQVSGLEQACGVEIFERVGRGLRLSDAGRVLVDHARGILESAEQALVAISRVDSVVEGTVVLAAYESVAATLLAPLFNTTRRLYPDLRIAVRQMDPDESIPALLRGDVDLAFTADYPHSPVGPTAGIHTWDIIHEPFRLVVPENDPLLKGPVRLDALADRPFISAPAGMGCAECIAAACRKAGFEPRVQHALDDYPTSLQLVAAGEGIAVIPDLGLIRLPAGVRVLALKEAVSRDVQLAVRSASATRPTFLAVRDALVDGASALSVITALHAA
jgi:DNA-binding transcriptional LysR family regulator